MREILDFIYDLGKEVAPVILEQAFEFLLGRKKVETPKELYTVFLETLLETGLPFALRKEAQNKLMKLAVYLFEHHQGVKQ